MPRTASHVSSAPLVLYSANTWLAYQVSARYFGNMHYVWCTPHFDPRQRGPLDSAVPPTSSPLELYRGLAEEVARGDRHSRRIEENRAGILRGANAKRAGGIITAQQEKQIVSIVELAEFRDFRPLIYVIPFAAAGHLVREPPPEDKAHPLSAEFIIDALPRDRFDAISLGDDV